MVAWGGGDLRHKFEGKRLWKKGMSGNVFMLLPFEVSLRSSI